MKRFTRPPSLVTPLALLLLLALLSQPASTTASVLDQRGPRQRATPAEAVPSSRLPQNPAQGTDNWRQSLQPTGPSVTKRITPSQGGSIASPDGKLAVTFPAGAVSEDVDATFTPLQRWTWGAPGMRIVNMFEMKASTAIGGAPVRDFAKDLEVTFQLSDRYQDNELAGLDINTLGLHVLDETTGKWMPLPASLKRGRTPNLTAKTRHFSVFGNQAAPMVSGPGTVLGFQNDPYSATSVARIPIELPPGPGGFAPRVELVYNSGAADDMKNKRDVGSWVGIGWSLKLGSISKNLETNKYYLDLSGSSYELVADPAAGSGVYRTKTETGFKVTKNGNLWQVWDRNGTEYRFGGSGGTSLPFYRDLSDEFCTTVAETIYRYDLYMIKDTHNNYVSISYNQDIFNSCGSSYKWDVVSAYPLNVVYGENTDGDNQISQNRFNVHFNASSDTSTAEGWIRNDNPSNPRPRLRDNKRLTSIEVKQDTNGDGVFETLVRKYNLTYNTTSAGGSPPYPAGTMTLTSFQQVGADGTSTLPAMTFTYSNPTTYFYDPGKPNDPNGNPGNPAQFTWPRLASVSNGYGATVSYSYDSIPDPNTSPQLIWVRAAATQRSTAPGIGPTQTVTLSYTGTPQYKIIDSNNRWLDEYRGFTQVRETDAASNYVEHFYYTVNPAPDGKDADKLAGKEYKTEWRDSGNTLLKQGIYSWNWAYCCVTNGSNSNVSWYVYLEQEDTTTGTKTARTRYTYDLPTATVQGYGNKIRENRDGDIGPTGDESTIFWAWSRNTSANILNTMGSEKVYAGDKSSDDGVGIKAKTTFCYDSYPTCSSPSKGDVVRLTRTITFGAEPTEAVTQYTYDSWGNRLSEIDPNGNTRSWTYDSSYHSLPVTENNPIVGSESATWDHGAGKILSWTDVNGQTISYDYDTFKRLAKVIKPGDSSESPSVRYNYNSWGTINQQNLEAQTKISGSDYIWSKQYFDSLGRIVQVQARGETEGAITYTIIERTTAFSNRGLVDREYVSQKLDSTTVSGYKAPEASWKYTNYAYDGLARVTSISKPDGTTIGHAYADWRDEATNERGYKKRYYSDAFGRLAKVEELDASHALYATTTYTYDVLGNLTNVTDNAGNQTNISYDGLSRKTHMTDPAMGTWSYQYDWSGNLTQQTDAKGQVLVFQYDALNRMTKKCNANCTSGAIATYSYDSTASGNYGKGRRTGMTDTPGSDAYTYDNRGRLITEARVIDNITYTTQYAYDGADRLTTTTYPTSEVVTQTYNGRGLPSTLSGSVAGNLVTGALYNQLGQATQIDLNNGLRTVFNYHGLDSVDSGDASSYWGKLYRLRTYKPSDGTDRLHLKQWWDAAGNLSSRTDVMATATESFGYDFLDRLTAGSVALPTGSLAARWKLGDGSGTSAADSSGNGHTGTLTNGPAWADGKHTKALSFDGVNDYVDVPDHSDFDFATGDAFTLSAWINTGQTSGLMNILEKWQDSGNQRSFYFYLEKVAPGWRLVLRKTSNGQAGTGEGAYSGLVPLQANTWHHVAVTRAANSTTVNFYFDGESAGSGTWINVTLFTGTANLGIGEAAEDGAYFNGKQDEILVYRRDLSADEVRRLYNFYDESYAYSAIGNLTSKNGTSYTYGSSRPHAVTAVGSASYSYDSNGSMTSWGGTTVTWDVQNMVTGVGSDTYTYDGDGVRVKKTQGGTTTVYVGRYYEKNVTSGEVTTYYYLGSHLVALRRGTTLEYVHQDHLGGSFVSTDGAGAQKAGIAYYPFGGTRASSGSLGTDRKFTGQRLDGSGLYYYGARYYDAGIGRFISADTMVQAPDNPQSLNRYAYAANNPLRYVDPSGNCWGPFGGACDRIADAFVQAAVQAAKNVVDLFVDAGKGAVASAAQTPVGELALEAGARSVVAMAYADAVRTAIIPELPAVKEVIQVPADSPTGIVLANVFGHLAVTLEQTVITTLDLTNPSGAGGFTPAVALHEGAHAQQQAQGGLGWYGEYLTQSILHGYEQNPYELAAYAAQASAATTTVTIVITGSYEPSDWWLWHPIW